MKLVLAHSKIGITGEQPMTELKACPFCGGEALIKTTRIFAPYEGTYYVVCFKCHVSQIAVKDKSTAIDQWNKRVADE